MMFISNAAGIRERLAWAIAEEDHRSESTGNVRQIVEDELLPSIIDYDPIHLVQVGMLAMIRDVQEWLDGHSHGDTSEPIDSKSLSAYLLAALITAGGVEDPLVEPAFAGDEHRGES